MHVSWNQSKRLKSTPFHKHVCECGEYYTNSSLSVFYATLVFNCCVLLILSIGIHRIGRCGYCCIAFLFKILVTFNLVSDSIHDIFLSVMHVKIKDNLHTLHVDNSWQLWIRKKCHACACVSTVCAFYSNNSKVCNK